MALSPGIRIGPYEIVAQIGAGGMGEVYKATDTNLKRGVAMKVLPESVTADPERLARFQREAEVLASLNHQNIAAVYGFERSGTTSAIAMELVDGPTLADRINGGPIPAEDALAIATQIADALEAAHEQGIVHRDLKPANVKVRADGVVKVLDFGLAKAVSPVAAMSISSSMSPTITTPAPLRQGSGGQAMTQAGIILGTAAYMSPEQARGKPVDRRTDIWAFGCVVYEMLTGRKAFDAEDVSLTLAEVMKSEPDWTVLPELPRAVRACLRRCFNKDPRQRLRDIGEMRLTLEGTADVEPDARIAPPPVRRRLSAWILPAVVAAALIVAALVVWLRPRPVPAVVRFEIHAPAGNTIPPGVPALSPDGRTLAYVATDSKGTRRIFVRDLNSTESRVLAGTEDAVYLFWAPAGRSLAFTVDGAGLKRVDIAGGSPRQLAPIVNAPWHGAWNQFGDVLFVGPGGLARVSADGGAPTRPAAFKSGPQETRVAFPAFFPDGRRLILHVGTTDGRSQIQQGSLDSSDRRTVLSDVTSAAVIAPTPSGRTYLVYARDDALVAHELDEASGQVRGTPRVIVDGIGKVANPAIRPTVGVSQSGVLAFQHGGEFVIVKLLWVDRDGKRVGDVPLDLSPLGVSLSPDGSRLAFDADSRSGHDLWVTDLKRNNTMRLTRDAEPERNPTWSPDGTRIAYVKGGKIYVRAADGLSDETVLADVGGALRDWSPDGKFLLRQTTQQLLVSPVTGGDTAIAIGRRDATSRDGHFSADSKYVAYFSNESGRDEIYIEALPPAKARVKVSQTGGTTPRWGVGSRELFFLGPDRGLMVVDVHLGQTLSVGAPRRIATNTEFGTTSNNRGFEVSPDGQRFLVRQLADDAPDTPITVVLNWWAEFIPNTP
jgi:Tol biopolymer transport system component